MKKIFNPHSRLNSITLSILISFHLWNKELLKVLSLKGDLKQQGLTVPVTLRKL